MKNPNGYGAVVYLGKGRRKPYAVRITAGRTLNSKGQYVQKYKYLEYFEKSKDAHVYLANMNSGIEVKEHEAIQDMPTFKDIYDKWLAYKQSLRKAPSSVTVRNYEIAFRRFSDLHARKFITLKPADYQPVADAIKEKSASTITMAKTVLSQMYEYAIKQLCICEKNYADYITWEYTETTQPMHIPFSDEELTKLWKEKDFKDADKVLMLIYTGLRAKEFLSIETKNIHLKEKYLIAGMKTEAGTNRTIPIHNAILPLFERYYNKNNKYLFQNTRGNAMEYTNFVTSYWTPLMQHLQMDHTMHDTRHTFATLADTHNLNEYYVKLIMGHSINDITKGVYTHVSIPQLVEEINRIII
ncbi:MAG: tyrosine-type recombinase/integrase [Lachnospiraceae bacterium]|nr:tyrosine-type recombinase/integrase [Lachnospiraceae bacterium]